MRREAETPADVKAYSQYPQREKQAHNIDVTVDVTEEGTPDQGQH